MTVFEIKILSDFVCPWVVLLVCKELKADNSSATLANDGLTKQSPCTKSPTQAAHKTPSTSSGSPIISTQMLLVRESL